MLLDLLRMVRGWVAFSVSGKYPERFINIASRHRVRLWNVHRSEDCFTACMYRSDYRRIRPLAHGAGVRLKVISKNGLPTMLFRYRERVGILIGACAFVLSIFVMSLFIWSIDITGLETVSRAEMNDVLRDHGLYIGAFKPSLDVQKLSRDVMIERHEIGWMAVNVTGSYASVEIKEEAVPPEVDDIYSPCNVKARSDGVIVRIEAAEGETMVMEGSGVIEGQLIVSGIRTDEQGTHRLVHADARVMARTTRQASFSMTEQMKLLRPNGEEAERQMLSFLGLCFPYRVNAVDSPDAVSNTEVEVPAPLGITLPIGVVTDRVSALSEEESALNDNSAEELLRREAQLYETFSLQNCEIESREYQLKHNGGVYTLYVTYTCVEDIALSEPIGTDENTDLTPYVAPTEKK